MHGERKSLDYNSIDYIHSLSKHVNSIYFSREIHDTDYGYYLFSKFSKTKDKHFLLKEHSDISSMEGEIVTNEKLKGFSKSIEILYDFEEIFNRDLYPNKKKYQNRIKSPLTLASKLGILVNVATIADLQDITDLHTQWVKMKLSDPRVHQITFSKKRYINCVELCIENPDYVCLTFTNTDKTELYGCRVLAKHNDILFDLAFFNKFWEVSQLSESLNVISMQYLQSKKFRYLNTGLASGTLKDYKKQYPHHEVYVFRTNQKLELTSDPTSIFDFF